MPDEARTASIGRLSPALTGKALARRRFLASSGATAVAWTLPAVDRYAAAAAPLVAPGLTHFRVLWKGKEIGHHTVEITHSSPGAYQVVTSIGLTVKAGPITVYRFNHHCTEEWLNGQLAAVRSTTNDDGRQAGISGQRSLAGLTLVTPAGPRQAPADILTSNSLWSARFPQQRQILDVRRGDVIPIAARPTGKAVVRIRGWTTAADAYDVATADVSGTILYLQDRWVGGQIRFNGEDVVYTLI